MCRQGAVWSPDEVSAAKVCSLCSVQISALFSRLSSVSSTQSINQSICQCPLSRCSQKRLQGVSVREQISLQPLCELFTTNIISSNGNVQRKFVPDGQSRDAETPRTESLSVDQISVICRAICTRTNRCFWTVGLNIREASSRAGFREGPMGPRAPGLPPKGGLPPNPSIFIRAHYRVN